MDGYVVLPLQSYNYRDLQFTWPIPLVNISSILTGGKQHSDRHWSNLTVMFFVRRFLKWFLSAPKDASNLINRRRSFAGETEDTNFFSCLQVVFSARVITTYPGVTSSMRFGSRTIGSNLGRSRALYDAVLLSHFMAFLLCSSNYNRLVSVTCKSRVFRKLFKTPFHVSLVCMQIPECYFVQGT